MSTTYRTCTTTRTCRKARGALPGGGLAAVLALCLGTGPVTAQPPAPPGGYPPGIELPEGEGREVLLTSCTRCHDLRGIPAYKGYWGKAEWLAMIDTMRRHGAAVGPQQAEAIASYLERHFGPGTNHQQ